MKMARLAGVMQFYLPKDLIERFLTMRRKARIDDLDLNIVIDLDGHKTKPSIRILNGNFEENNFVEIKRDAE